MTSPPPPASLEAECAVLGACLIDPGAIPRVGRLLSPEDFSVQENAWVMAALQALFKEGETTDLLTISEFLRRKGQLAPIGGMARLTELINQTPSSQAVGSHARIVKDCSYRRNLLQEASRLAVAAHNQSEDAHPIVHRICSDLLGGSDKFGATSGPPSISLPAAVERISGWREKPLKPGEVRGIPTGIGSLDRMLGGLEPSLVLCGGQTSIGKTAFALQLLLNIASKGYRACFVTGEMSVDQLLVRMLSSIAQVSLIEMKRGLNSEQWARVSAAAEIMGELPIWMDASCSTVGDIRSLAYQRKAKEGLDILMIDYLGCFVPRDSDHRPLKLGTASGSLLHLSRELDACIFANHQLRRESDTQAKKKRGVRRPKKEDLQWSGMLAQDADIVLLLWREALATSTSDGRPNPKGRSMEIICDKNRLTGRLGRAHAYFGEHAEVKDREPGLDRGPLPEEQEEIPF